ncbi:hypothetical protein MATL_G00135760 [Megalops atlanticus]|uniref:Uncharacterized protein n=1 Tax=Megalops atlanticus TaxID=7932 RepID=A0A9D3TCB4_MEGAT|nr:hypothetical protein MATL_G00135760 [Megalops atlanticus]
MPARAVRLRCYCERWSYPLCVSSKAINAMRVSPARSGHIATAAATKVSKGLCHYNNPGIRRISFVQPNSLGARFAKQPSALEADRSQSERKPFHDAQRGLSLK